jgi:hypothetical protein
MTNPNETFLSRRHQAARWSVSKRSVERWGEDQDLGLPSEIEINGRHYRKLSELEAWERKRAVAAATKRSERKQRNPEADVPTEKTAPARRADAAAPSSSEGTPS